MLSDRKKIINFIKFLPLISSMSVAIILVAITIQGIYNHFSNNLSNIEKTIKQETHTEAVKTVKYMYRLMGNFYFLINSSYQKEIRTAVDIGAGMVSNIEEEKSKLPYNKLIKKIIHKLKNIRFYDDESGYYFLLDTKGKILSYPTNPKLEGKNFINFKDAKGRYIVKQIIEDVQRYPDGVYEEWYEKVDNKIVKKWGYFRYIEKLHLIIGSEFDYATIEKEIKYKVARIIPYINIIDYKKVFLFNEKGGVVFAKSTYDKSIIQNIIKQAHSLKVNFYSQNNQEFAYGYYEPLNIVVIYKIDTSTLFDEIAQRTQKLNSILKTVVLKFLAISFIFIFIILAMTIYVIKRIEAIFDKYEHTIIEEKEKAEVAAKVKSEFLANMSHEIRTPLNAMFGFIRILEESEEDKEKKKYLNIIEKSGENLLTIINDILDFSKIEAGKFNIEKIEFNPKEDIEILYELFKSKASEKNILLEIEEDLKYNIISDPTRIKQVVANLLSNAIKFTDKGKKVYLTIKYDENKEELYIEVKDEGIGIPKEKLSHVFEAFSQADSSTTRKYGGTGLGLTISYKLVQLLGGELKVESEEGKGSKFYFTIPAKKTTKIKEIQKQKNTKLDDNYNMHILLVEDNQANQMFMKIIMKKMGLTFDIANNGLEAIEKFKENRYDLILMDENMPIMNGIEATQKIRDIEQQEHLTPTYIVALTANALEGDKERFILAGMDFYLPKPLDVDKLKEVLNKIKDR